MLGCKSEETSPVKQAKLQFTQGSFGHHMQGEKVFLHCGILPPTEQQMLSDPNMQIELVRQDSDLLCSVPR